MFLRVKESKVKARMTLNGRLGEKRIIEKLTSRRHANVLTFPEKRGSCQKRKNLRCILKNPGKDFWKLRGKIGKIDRLYFN